MINLLLFSLAANAVPLQLTQQGRMLDSNGMAIEGSELVFFRIYDDLNGGNLLWEEYVTTPFTNGYYAAVLGADVQNNPLDSTVLSLYPIYLELQLGSNTPMSPRTEITSTPYAQIAGMAETVEGGTVDASEILIGGNAVIDGTGLWVGQPLTVDWANVQGIPSDIADGDANTQLSETQVEGFINNGAIDLNPLTTMNGSGLLTQADTLTPDWSNLTNRPTGLDDGDDDTLAGLGCAQGEIVGWDGLNWVCTSDNNLTESEVETYITNGGINLDASSTVGGFSVLTTNDDSLSTLSCLDNELPRYDSISGEWFCASDGLAQKVCANGEVITYNTNTADWECTNFQSLLDGDSDGVMAWADCNDNDSNVLSSANDADCDGITTALDCDDADPNSTGILNDADCDGTLTTDDCNDNDPNSNTVATDADCDGDLDGSDCDDTDSSIYNGATEVCNDGIDQDCDGADDLSCLSIYSFTSHTFTPCGATGINGPSTSACSSEYGTSWSSNSNYFVVDAGVQLWTVPATGNYLIETYGAQGGANFCGDQGAKGARMSGEFSLTSGTELSIVIGQMGQRSPSGNCANGGGGGGGGSFVWESGASQPLIVAGGGAGSSLTNNGSPNYLGIGGVTSTEGSPARDNSAGGVNGSDGTNGGGRGWNTVRTDASGELTDWTHTGTGGFGGGDKGGGACGGHVSGGGGGYSGGGAGGCYYAAGGGGSYNAGANQSNTGDTHSGDGQVVITYLGN